MRCKYCNGEAIPETDRNDSYFCVNHGRWLTGEEVVG